jgi:hypothetical protein
MIMKNPPGFGLRRSAPLSSAIIAIILVLLSIASTPAADLPTNYKLLHEETFDKESSLTRFQMTDTNAWKWVSTNDTHGGTMELVKQSDYKPAVRSPVNIALIKDKVFGDFVLEADLIQTGKEYGHRDMCIFFGFQSPTNFYYTHMATAADPNAHNVFIVNGAPRKNFAKETTKGVAWGLNIWHKVRLERSTANGMIKVYFDDMTKPIMIAQDSTFKSGAIGFGSFDDTGRVDNIKIWGTGAEMKATSAFPKP